MVTKFRLRGSASGTTFGMCEQAARTLIMVAIDAVGWKSTVTHCWPSAASNFAQPTRPPARPATSAATPVAARTRRPARLDSGTPVSLVRRVLAATGVAALVAGLAGG